MNLIKNINRFFPYFENIKITCYKFKSISQIVFELKLSKVLPFSSIGYISLYLKAFLSKLRFLIYSSDYLETNDPIAIDSACCVYGSANNDLVVFRSDRK